LYTKLGPRIDVECRFSVFGLQTVISLFMVTSNKVQFVKVAASQVGQRLDNFLLGQLKGVPRSRIYRLVRRGEVRINKKRAKPDTRLEPGDTVRIPPYSGPEPGVVPAPSDSMRKSLEASILQDSANFLVLNKPAGIAVHGGSGIRLGLIEALRQLRPEWSDLELVHRLDRDTSGCLLVSKNAQFLKQLHQQLKEKRVQKHYLALVHGSWPENLVEVDAPLQKQELASGERIVRLSDEGKASRTRFRVLERYKQATLVEAMPETGRTHQIRVHCLSTGHPIIGDAKYAHGKHREGLEEPLASNEELCLHAWKMGFTDPESGNLLEIEARPQKQFQGLLDQLK